MPRPLVVVSTGCVHGELADMYASIQATAAQRQTPIDLVLCTGDFEAMRNIDDLDHLACPDKFRYLNSFAKYYSGELVAPYLTLIIGGNHEASNHFRELFHGGWVAPNMYYLGVAGVVQCAGLRIAGWSGIFKGHDCRKGHFERPPYDRTTIRSLYHTRVFDQWRLAQLATSTKRIDLFLSHDWPRQIAQYGNVAQLVRHKPFLKSDIDQGRLGSPLTQALLHDLRPAYWFAAHLHTRFAAVVRHPTGPSSAPGDTGQPMMTKFLALGKVVPGKPCLQFLTFPTVLVDAAPRLEYDVEWLAIVKSTIAHLPTMEHAPPLPTMSFPPNAQATAWVEQRLQAAWTQRTGKTPEGQEYRHIPLNFVQSAPIFDPRAPVGPRRGMPKVPEPRDNPQYVEFLELLQIPDVFAGMRRGVKRPAAPLVSDPHAIVLSESEDDPMQEATEEEKVADPNAIALSSEDDQSVPAADGNAIALSSASDE